ncbi:MAG: DUF3843 family protein [Vicingaceae bacterium]|nr:DUF3843 family protein [Vicingaceae bacterium]
MKNFRNKNKIYIQDWIEFKPYDKQVKTDVYYIKIANKVKEAIAYEFPYELDEFFEPHEKNMLACFLTSYFEDIISETNVWNTFVKKHKELYNKEVPFFEIDDEYYPREINQQDIAFLIWYFFNSMQNEKIIHFYNDFIENMAFEVMEVFEEEFEFAPENEHLKAMYQVTLTKDDFYTIRELTLDLLKKNYLFIPDTGLTFRLEIEDVLENAIENNDDEEHLMLKLRETELSLLTKRHTKLLNFKGNEWFAYILGENHPLYNAILTMGNRIAGFFFYRGEDENDVFLEHISSGMQFKLTKKSLEEPLSIKNNDDLVFVGIQRWQNEWWFSGNFFTVPFDADFILDQKNSIVDRQQVNFIDHEVNKANLKEQMDEQEKSFLAFNNQSYIAYLPKNEIDKFCENYYHFYNKALNLSEKEKQDAIKRVKEDGFTNEEIQMKSLVNDADTAEIEEAIVFYNPKSGIEVATGINGAFPAPENKFYSEEHNYSDTLGLIVNEEFSAELVHYCIDNFKEKSEFFNSYTGKQYLMDLDFILRFYKGNNYQAKPQITILGKEKANLF